MLLSSRRKRLHDFLAVRRHLSCCKAIFRSLFRCDKLEFDQRQGLRLWRQGSFISYESALSKTFSPLDDGTAPPARKEFQDAFYDEERWEMKLALELFGCGCHGGLTINNRIMASWQAICSKMENSKDDCLFQIFQVTWRRSFPGMKIFSSNAQNKPRTSLARTHGPSLVP